ncbi:MAG: HAD family hydrolase [Actinomycetota bacterium]|nr:HAD family hydrolase [Actinomycetota bacterium]
MPLTAILDVDGTLVDSNYHHAIAWFRALRLHGVVLPVWRIHRAMGMGGDQLLGHLVGEGFEEQHGQDVRGAEKALYGQLISEVQAAEGARGLMEDLKGRGCTVILASSAKPEELAHYLDLLDARGLADDWTDSSDVATTKPAPDLVQVALDKAGGPPAVMVGDSTWDCEAAKRAKVDTIAVRTGGYGVEELREAGADPVFDSVVALREGLSSTPFG